MFSRHVTSIRPAVANLCELPRRRQRSQHFPFADAELPASHVPRCRKHTQPDGPAEKVAVGRHPAQQPPAERAVSFSQLAKNKIDHAPRVRDPTRLGRTSRQIFRRHCAPARRRRVAGL